jgi:glyoxylase-like metal-dependent hydrolase (beta-lactamase superfamily II)
LIPSYKVHALRLGTITADKGGVTYGRGYGTPIDIPIWSAAVEGGGYKILVDTGMADAGKWLRYHPCSITPSQTLPAALAELGWEAKDIDIVINTHLHYDHSENNLKLSNAQFYVSRAEWEFAAHPIETQAWSYDVEWTSPELTYMNYTLIDVDHYDILPGVRVIKTPGHTPGHQSVVVKTEEGLLCVAGDAACIMENLSAHIPPAVHVSVDESLRSIDKIGEFSERILMTHDPEIGDFQDSNFPLIPKQR